MMRRKIVEMRHLSQNFFFKTEKINLLRNACFLIDVSQESHQAAYKVLRNLQLDLRNTPTTQTTLDMWLK